MVYFIVVSFAEEAAGRVNDFINTNRRLPNYVSCDCFTDVKNTNKQRVKISMPTFLYVMTLLLNTPPIEVVNNTNINPPTAPSGTYHSGTIQESEYRDIADKIKKFMENNGRAPNYANSTLGQIQYPNLIDLFSMIWTQTGKNNNFPPSVKLLYKPL